MNVKRTGWMMCLAGILLWSGCRPKLVDDLPPPAGSVHPSLAELQPAVDRLLAGGDNVLIRRGITDVFTLIDLLLEAGRTDEALRYLDEALTHHSWALDYQMRYAELLAQQGRPDEARQKAKLVEDYTEQDDLMDRARRLLGEEPLPFIPDMQALSGEAPTLVLVPVGQVDRCLLYDLSREISGYLNLPVLVQDAQVKVPRYKRDPVRKHFAQVRANLLAAMKKDPKLAALLKLRGLNKDVLQDDQALITACRYLAYQSGGTNTLAQYDAGLQQFDRVPKQWDMEELLLNVRAAVQPYLRKPVYFIGVANLDAFAGESNFLFGTAENQGQHAMMSYRRFTAAFNDEQPNRKRLVERSMKQALSSFGFLLGVPRCSDPTCARAYPHNLAEHDAKSSRLCPACQKGFEQALKPAIEAGP